MHTVDTVSLVRSLEFHGPKATPRVVTRKTDGTFVDTVALDKLIRGTNLAPTRKVYRYKSV